MVDASANTNVFPALAPRVVTVDGTADLFSALTAADYSSAGFRAPRREGAAG
jgi:hypothetical protein